MMGSCGDLGVIRKRYLWDSFAGPDTFSCIPRSQRLSGFERGGPLIRRP